jgi:hypothetical protein
MPLSADELDAITNLIAPLPPALRDEFIAAVEAALAGRVGGPGLAHRTALGLLPSFFHPPPRSPKPQFFRRPRSR